MIKHIETVCFFGLYIWFFSSNVVFGYLDDVKIEFVSDSLLEEKNIKIKKFKYATRIKKLNSLSEIKDERVRYFDTLLYLAEDNNCYLVEYNFAIGNFDSLCLSGVLGFSNSGDFKFAFYQRHTFLSLRSFSQSQFIDSYLFLNNLKKKVETYNEIKVKSIEKFNVGICGFIDCRDFFLGKVRFYFKLLFLLPGKTKDGFPQFYDSALTKDYLEDINNLSNIEDLRPVIVFETRPQLIPLSDDIEHREIKLARKHIVILDLYRNEIIFDGLLSQQSDIVSIREM